MKVTLHGGILALASCIVSTAQFMVFELTILLFLTFLKYSLGERVMRPLYRLSAMYQNFVQRLYFMFVGGLLELVLQTQVAYTIVDTEGQHHLEQFYMTTCSSSKGALSAEGRPNLEWVLQPPSKAGKSKIIIMNHYCRLDWLYMFLIFSRSPSISSCVRFVLKSDLRGIPVLGWCMELFGYLFLTRSWESDATYIEQMISFYKEIGDTPVIFIFPEGTDLSPSNVEKSQAFAAKTGLPKFHRVLNPRTTGLVAMTRMLGGAAAIEEVIDITIGYTMSKPGERPSEASLLNGQQAKKVHVLINRYKTADCLGDETATDTPKQPIAPMEESQLAAWIHERFAEKEQLLSRFATANPVGFDTADVRAVLGSKIGVATYDDSEEIIRHPQETAVQRYIKQVGLGPAVFCVLWWVALPLYFVFFSRWLRALLFTFVVLYALHRFLRSVNGVQQLLFLHKVDPDGGTRDAMAYRLYRWARRKLQRDRRHEE